MKERIPEQQERKQGGRVFLYEEMRPLKDLVIWGEPGAETVLAQLLPESVSLFWQKFDVVEARKEYRGMVGMFQKEGINLIRLKEVVAANPNEFSLTNVPANLQGLKDRLFAKAELYFSKYHLNSLDQAKKDISRILEEDMAKYGSEKTVIFLNTLLSLSNQLPMANIFYARDQSNALGSNIVMSNMRRDIRQPEVAVFQRAYDILGYSQRLVNLPEGYFEGGDGYIFGDKCLIGSGYRSSREGIAGIYRGVGRNLNLLGIQVYNVPNTRKLKEGEEMDAMHLDTFMMPLNSNTVLACGEEVDNRVVELVSMKGEDVVFTKIATLRRFLNDNGVRIVNITKEEQLLYSTNFLHLGHKKVIVPLEDEKHTRVNGMMASEGLDVKVAGIKELVGGYGAVHCMTAAIVRE